MNMYSLGRDNLLTGHMIVANDDRWVWFAINSVLNYVSKLIIYDTGSVDNTIRIIKSIRSEKIVFKEIGKVDSFALTKLRQDQVEKTKTDWFLVIDGDEVWPQKSLESVIKAVKNQGENKLGIVVKTGMCVGDIYHFQDEKAGKYKIGNKKGHYNIRFFRKKDGYHWIYPYPDEAYVDKHNTPIQNTPDRLLFIDVLYWHLRHLPRSTKIRNKKIKIELGESQTIDIPEVFFKKRPQVVLSPFIRFSDKNYIKASLLSPFIKLKRTIHI